VIATDYTGVDDIVLSLPISSAGMMFTLTIPAEIKTTTGATGSLRFRVDASYSSEAETTSTRYVAGGCQISIYTTGGTVTLHRQMKAAGGGNVYSRVTTLQKIGVTVDLAG
jgi:hypothetical protein